ncbi:MAG: DUF2797 domain-containing protein [Flavobacteriales bacterium]|jgi:hypothetical protein
MNTRLDEKSMANYSLAQIAILDYLGELDVNSWVGHHIQLAFTGNIHCIATGKKIKKTYGEGLSYDAWLSSPLGNPAIINPELSRIHEGIALRDREWEEKHHNQPHYVYLSRTSGVKVGVTRATNLFSRWIDQGAVEGIILAHTPYRQLAGLIEVALKEHMDDKTAWQAMLKGEFKDTTSLTTHKESALGLLPEDYFDFISDDDTITHIHYPIDQLPSKPRSLKFDSNPVIEGKLLGIKGQYLLFDSDRVFNIRSHAGYEATITVS